LKISILPQTKTKTKAKAKQEQEQPPNLPPKYHNTQRKDLWVGLETGEM
jgi:hypothetical protein